MDPSSGRPTLRWLRLLVLCSFTACAPSGPQSADGDVPALEIGDPLPGLTGAERTRFDRGRALFARIYTPEEGLGPRYNENSCSACHTFPVDGGTGETAVRKATRHSGRGGSCDLMTPSGGENLRRQVTPVAAERGAVPVSMPPDREHEATFSIPFVFGLGLVEALPLDDIRRRADPDDGDADGISGRLGRDVAGRPARFGRKSDVATLLDFTDSALRLEMGLTTPAAPDERRAGATPPVPTGSDPAPEPEVDSASVADLVAFLTFLAPPPTGDDSSTEAGAALFTSLGCADCHVPHMETGPSPSPALDRRPVALFSDLLLHDMGPALAGTCAPGATPTEYRTEPLMGLRYRETFLHDGRARRVRDAILLHGGEATAARDRFAALDRLAQEELLRYLRTL